MFTLFKKELHQHGAFVLAMVFMCLLFQVAYCTMAHLTNLPLGEGGFLLIAIIVTALYAGAATALAYSTEHADNTYIFLRKMPISLATIASGKIGWALCGTLLVLIGNLLLAACWSVLGYGADAAGIWNAWGIGIAEAFVWGLFWSPRCRSQVNALLTGYACASGTAFGITFLYFTFVGQSSMDVTAMYSTTLPYRCAAVVIVGLLALRGAFQWFEFDTKSSTDSRFSLHNVGWLRYPKRVQGPFFGLVHHHLRHASLIYHFGILCMVVFSSAMLIHFVTSVLCGFYAFNSDKILQPYGWYVSSGAIVCIAGMVLFWATIFGHDQKNDSYRFLSRLGIPEGKVWWSRMLPATFCYTPVIVWVLGGILWSLFINANNIHGCWYNGRSWTLYDYFVMQTLPQLQMAFTIWLIPLAVGAFLSISFRSQMVAIALAVAGMLTLIGWMSLGWILFAASPLWTTVPICIALLIASRIRASYWLRETSTWRSRLIPLSFVFGAGLAVLIALPFVRIYSIPYVSWEQIDAYFDQAESPIIRSPEKRKALLQYIAKHNAVPAEYEHIYAKTKKEGWWNVENIGDWTYEELLLIDYVQQRDWLTQPINVGSENKARYIYLTRYTPWELVRIERSLRLQIIAAFAQEVEIRNGKAGASNSFTLFREKQSRSQAVFDYKIWWRDRSLAYYLMWGTNDRRLNDVRNAVEKWYVDHDRTLPESLDELVEASYLDAVPVHSFTQEAATFHRDAPLPLEKRGEFCSRHFYERGDRISVHVLGRPPKEQPDWREQSKYIDAFRKSGCTYLQLGRLFVVLIEEEEQE